LPSITVLPETTLHFGIPEEKHSNLILGKDTVAGITFSLGSLVSPRSYVRWAPEGACALTGIQCEGLLVSVMPSELYLRELKELEGFICQLKLSESIRGLFIPGMTELHLTARLLRYCFISD
jgi:hypothetical protein